MDESPLVSKEIKDYCKNNKIEDVLNQTMQVVLTSLPADPFSVMSALLKEVYSFLYCYLA